MSKYLSIALIIIALIVGTGIGYVLTPQYSMPQQEHQGLGKADKYIDLRYINAMITHHKEAMNLASQVKDQSKNRAIKELSIEILENEPKAIAELEQFKREWYNYSSDVSEGEVPNLGTYDEKLDLRFLNALIAHHLEGIEMAKEVQTKSSKNEILNNADSVITFLNNGEKTLKLWREEWYGIK